ncbi:MAG: allantoinase PuuE [Granulosicoccus sp.]|nr:allantoinase PuuE [Granulosicoccus sp.]
MKTALYPRDLVGYGQHAPDPKWPDNARIAVQFVLNVEEGGENNILHGDAASEAFLSEIVGASAWPDQRHMNMESIYEYGSRRGFWRVHRLFTERDLPLTVFGVATALAKVPEAVAAMQEANWEIATHGLKWIDYKDYASADETRHLQQAIELHTEVTGQQPQGVYIGRTSVHSHDLCAAIPHFEYCADTYADELPYWRSSEHGPQLMVPYTLDANDMRFATPQGFNSGDQFLSYLKDSFDMLYEEGVQGAAKMMSIGLHSRLVGRPGRAAALERFIEYVQKHEHVWITRRIDIARHWRTHFPPSTS